MTTIVEKQTKAYNDQKPGTSGLRKKVTHFQQENYIENFVQATFNALAKTDGIPEVLALGGDGRYLSEEASQIIVRMAAANGVKRIVVGVKTLISTPAVSAVIRTHPSKPTGAFILTASHNPGGPKNDFGMKYNGANGGPAPEKFTNLIYDESVALKTYKILEGTQDVDFSKPSTHKVSDSCVVEVIDTVSLYADMMATIFDFEAIKKLLSRKDFAIHFDAMHGVAGPYARRILVDMLGADAKSVHNADPQPDFAGGHPDPNLTYAHDLVAAMGLNADGTVRKDAPANVPAFGAACDGDADRNMVLGGRFFVSPSDSVAVIAANASSIPYFKKNGLKALARSMPTSGALDLVAKKLGVPFFEVPTGWKFFGNLMDSKPLFSGKDYEPLICGEESFGTGSSHVREKDGLWAVLCWLNILADRNRETTDGKLITVQAIVEEHWATYGRNYYCRFDYEEVDAKGANELMDALRSIDKTTIAPLPSGVKVATADDFCYKDSVDGSSSLKQGVRIIYEDGSRFVLRLSGTGSVGATIRLYLEQYVSADEVKAMLKQPGGVRPSGEALAPLVDIALRTAKIEQYTGRKEPTVIT
jgi:phosphoglucomutase